MSATKPSLQHTLAHSPRAQTLLLTLDRNSLLRLNKMLKRHRSCFVFLSCVPDGLFHPSFSPPPPPSIHIIVSFLILLRFFSGSTLNPPIFPFSSTFILPLIPVFLFLFSSDCLCYRTIISLQPSSSKASICFRRALGEMHLGKKEYGIK